MDTYEPCEFFATCLPGAEGLLADELRALGVGKVRPLKGGAAFYGKPQAALYVCLWSRLAGRVNCVVGRVGAQDADALYDGVRMLPWEDEVAPGASVAVKVSGTNAQLRNTQFTALKVKDAVCDRLAEVRGARPDVDPKNPDCLIEVRLRDQKATVSVDLSGAALTHRSYLAPDSGPDAPVMVALSATLLAFAGAGELFAADIGFENPAAEGDILDAEAAELREDRAPGLLRERWGFFGWARASHEAWDDLLAEADNRCEAASGASGARGVAGASCADRNDDAPVLVACVAPSWREDDDAGALSLRAACVEAARRAPAGSCFAFAGVSDLEARFKSTPRTLEVGRGRSEAVLQVFDEAPAEPVTIAVANPAGGTDLSVEVNDAGAAQFAARLRKVARERRKWAAREDVHAYRVYDADLPEYAAAIDLYEGAGSHKGELFVHVAEYQAPKSVDEGRARARFEDMLALVPAVLGVSPDHVFSKARKRARGGGQYRDAGGRSYVTRTTEDSLTFELDLGGYLDTGLFLDHRDTRRMVGQMAKGKTFLNLFAYTGAATVHAAAAGAAETTTVDLSQTYLDWAARNMTANGFIVDGDAADSANDKRSRKGRVPRGAEASRRGRTFREEGSQQAAHHLVRADVTRWITEARRAGRTFDLIFVDPPTFSNSKAMGKRTWDVQRDHVELLIGVSRLLAPGGTAVFSCNLRNFKPDTEALARYGVQIEDITPRTIPHDFERNPRIHHCYIVRRA